MGLELTTIAAVVIGGTSLFGGRGTVAGAVVGVLLLALVQNAINILQVPANWDLIVGGAVIMIAAGLDTYRRSRSGGQ
jgi:ribose transport system permease protein